MSTFDPAAFMAQTTKGPMETKRTPVPEDEYHDVYCGKPQVKAFPKKDGQPGLNYRLEIPMEIKDEGVAESIGTERAFARWGDWLDVDESGALLDGTNNNTKLGALREALGQNEDDEWSINMLEGAGPISAIVVHEHDSRPGNDNVYPVISRVASSD